MQNTAAHYLLRQSQTTVTQYSALKFSGLTELCEINTNFFIQISPSNKS